MDSSRILGKRNPVKDSLKGFFFLKIFKRILRGFLGGCQGWFRMARDCSGSSGLFEDPLRIFGWIKQGFGIFQDDSKIWGIFQGCSKDFWVD